MTSNCEVAPNASSATASVDDTSRASRCSTVTDTDWVTVPLATVTVVMPLPCAVTRPAALTVATVVSVEVQLRVAVIELPFPSCAVACNGAVASIASSVTASGTTAMRATRGGGSGGEPEPPPPPQALRATTANTANAKTGCRLRWDRLITVASALASGTVSALPPVVLHRGERSGSDSDSMNRAVTASSPVSAQSTERAARSSGASPGCTPAWPVPGRTLAHRDYAFV